MRELLALRGLRAGYGLSTVLEDLDFTLGEGESLALLGRNGVGKSTLLTAIMGLACVHAGSIRFVGADITQAPTWRRARMGVGWVPQERLTFASLTVEEHLTSVAQPGHWNLKRVYEVLPLLEPKRTNRGKQLSGGEQQMLAIGRALMTNPRLLLLDEPLEGLAPVIAQQVLDVVTKVVSQQGLSAVIVEQHAGDVLPITHKALVLERGRIAWQGGSRALAGDAERMNALLGVAGAAA